MSRVITFSLKHPSYTAKRGQPTWFVEKVLKCFDSEEQRRQIFDHKTKFRTSFVEYEKAQPKWHTIRLGNRWKAGMNFSPRYWSGRPYFDPQTTFKEDVEIKEVYSLTIREDGAVWFQGKLFGTWLTPEELTILAANDGLTYPEFVDWLILPVIKKGKKVEAQIICWKVMDYDNIFLPF